MRARITERGYMQRDVSSGSLVDTCPEAQEASKGLATEKRLHSNYFMDRRIREQRRRYSRESGSHEYGFIDYTFRLRGY